MLRPCAEFQRETVRRRAGIDAADGFGESRAHAALRIAASGMGIPSVSLPRGNLYLIYDITGSFWNEI